MRKRKTRTETLALAYLNQTDIMRLLNINRESAKKVYQIADKIDAELGAYRVEPRKVRMKSVLKATGTDYGLLARQIKG